MNITRLQAAEIPQIWHCLQQISDPELPVLSITDLGMVRDVEAEGHGWRITFTPTYSGCPATEFLLEAIEQRLAEAGFSPVRVTIQLSPAWTTDWMNAAARERLREYGVAPPQGHTCDKPLAHGPVPCPRCGSTHSEKISEFGSTACKALYRCCDCREPFDYFKCI
ncbi:1,2-phenylacetyl-CoA epoxidase subunit PaaD [Serratia proteamaculans]|jgi:ring-1,2-phenylacetyl-CoA epoxidase subunit PaaD|uniref:1,2-phenylacetyl-CoA epoxidase subunit PaaD n=1 Tax=Serratia proteamaculans TaxID=28151 RepID=UPI00217AE28C|nr:1,2-phenylacetyl-CoA epoxidase subunit PaaD [Serratia proteamaculans]CAI0960346.1 phenylacetate-CoA oxygenase, PaaJ subunit [Serratia proteamaculans]CAI1667485.1 phenylacetate-CoA oxygenase, PaaJ subunit [Serratia proteamaculans]CAI1707507.1 phenylacetate-CoA oxygenase, PaaJ subunit [Serratia proteamaculans]CAI1719071.1 phenylacetate-CoA oxygenase, PaaJ subunit [Serratia proteamaculans]CAI2437378.1 phenylacetate-CoA oxygenase, PaaJ subunit [Serratia proteamaculans]